jgi:hypothetical protein
MLRTLMLLSGCGLPMIRAMNARTPMAALIQRQSARLQKFYQVFDASRYHVQVLCVDDDGIRGRTCEAMLERVSIWADAGWWIFPSSASIGPSVDEGSTTAAQLPSLQRSFSEWNLCKSRLAATSTKLDPSDVVSGAYDLILCVDSHVLDSVRAMVRANGGDECSVMAMADFTAYACDRMANLDDELRSLVAPHYAQAGGGGLVELPDAAPSDRNGWERFLAASALTSGGVVGFLKDGIDDFFVRSYERLLQVHWPTVESVRAARWEDAEVLIRRYEVTGGLDPRIRQEMFEAHCDRLQSSIADGGTSDEQTSVDETKPDERSRGGKASMCASLPSPLTCVEADNAPSWDVLTEQVLRTPTGTKLEMEALERATGRGAPHIDATLRLFDAADESHVRVTLYRDAAGWCPYCQKVQAACMFFPVLA